GFLPLPLLPRHDVGIAGSAGRSSHRPPPAEGTSLDRPPLALEGPGPASVLNLWRRGHQLPRPPAILGALPEAARARSRALAPEDDRAKSRPVPGPQPVTGVGGCAPAVEN